MTELKQIGPMLFKVSGTDKKPEEQINSSNLWRAQETPKKTAVDGLLEIPSREQWASSPEVGNTFVNLLRDAMGLNSKQAQYLQELITDTYHAEDEAEDDKKFKSSNSIFNKNYKETFDELLPSFNKLTFRNPNEGEKVGTQRIEYLMPGEFGEKGFHTATLLVPERESVGYGNIRGWGSPENLEDSSYAPVTNAWGNMSEASGFDGAHAPGFGRNIADTTFFFGSPLSVAGDLIGRTAALNTTKNDKSKYTGDPKAVGLGKKGESEGQIFGLIDENGKTYGPQETVEWLKNNIRLTGPYSDTGNAVYNIVDRPTQVQEHNGPAYVPGDLLLGLLGLQPNRGAVGFTFPEYNYSDFVKNYRETAGNNWRSK